MERLLFKYVGATFTGTKEKKEITVNAPLPLVVPYDTDVNNYKFIVTDGNGNKFNYTVEYVNDGLTQYKIAHRNGNLDLLAVTYFKNANNTVLSIRPAVYNETGLENLTIEIYYSGNSEIDTDVNSVIVHFSNDNIYLLYENGNVKTIKQTTVETPNKIIVRFNNTLSYYINENGIAEKRGK